jgi:hypothetical protein
MVDQTALPQVATIGGEKQGGRILLRRNKRRRYAAQTTIAMVSSPVKVINTLWPQRAVNSSMFDLL